MDLGDFSEREWLGIVGDESKRSIGFEFDDELNEDRERGLEYYKGEMRDVKSLPRRSKAVSTDIAEAVETVLPDLVDIFIGEDVAAFEPVGQEDEAAAEQETDYLNHVVFKKNPGFLNFYTAFKDALLLKTGIWKVWWEDYEEVEEERFEGKSEDELMFAMSLPDVEVVDVEETYAPADGEVYPGLPGMAAPAMYDFTIRRTMRDGCAKFEAVAPEDFTVAPDTKWLAEATYCAMRSHPRRQDLIAEGYDPDKVNKLSADRKGDDENVDQARDTANETDEFGNAGTSALEQVEVIEHYIRIDARGTGKPQIWRVVTGENETILLDAEEREQIEFAAITPYIQPHRFYGQSLADKLFEIQRIKTALLRMLLDNGYFALNQRLEVSETAASENTISDLLRNEPGVPVRSKDGQAVRPITSGGINFDIAGALEYISTMSEQRTGIVRNAQGLNPDTLHDTAKGAMALMTQAQKRIRLIARIFAETGVKDLFLCMHRLIRSNASKASIERLRGKWVPVDPTSWGVRKDMTIEIGLGAGGREQEAQMAQAMLDVQKQIVEFQGGANGPLVTLENLHNAVTRFADRLGAKAPERYFTDPATAEPQPEKPDPEVVEAQMEAQRKTQEAQMDAEIQRYKIDQEMAAKREQMEREFALKREQMGAEFALKREQMAMEARLRVVNSTESSGMSPVRPGGAVG